MMVRVLRTQKSRFSRFPLVLLGLAISVFAWGLQYKLSLYDPPQSISHQIPEAKLLSRNEQTQKAKGSLVDVSGTPAKTAQVILSSIFLLISFVLKLLRGPVSIGREGYAQLYWRHDRLACFDAFFFRPPPVLA